MEAKTSCEDDYLYYLDKGTAKEYCILKCLSIEWKQRQAAKRTICTTLTRGQPRNIVRSCLRMTADKGFAVAKKLLKEHFGNKFKITAAYMEMVTGWPSVKSEDTKHSKHMDFSCINVPMLWMNFSIWRN